MNGGMWNELENAKCAARARPNERGQLELVLGPDTEGWLREEGRGKRREEAGNGNGEDGGEKERRGSNQYKGETTRRRYVARIRDQRHAKTQIPKLIWHSFRDVGVGVGVLRFFFWFLGRIQFQK